MLAHTLTLTPPVLLMPSDLYHFGHFALKFRFHRRALIDHGGFDVLAEEPGAGGSVVVDVAVRERGGAGSVSRWRFAQRRADAGSAAGCWLTDALLPLDA